MVVLFRNVPLIVDFRQLELMTVEALRPSK
jgi:hypothetical protein